MLSSPFRQKPVLFSWRLPPHEPSSLPAGANYYTQSFYQTMLKFSIACSDKDLLLMRRQRERRRNWQAGQSGTHFAACQPANPVGFTLGKQGGLEPLFACWGNLSPSPFERFLQNRLRSCEAFFACGASGNRGVEHFSPPYLWVAPPDDLAVLVGAVPDLRTVP